MVLFQGTTVVVPVARETILDFATIPFENYEALGII
jgi:hypothetical protein